MAIVYKGRRRKFVEGEHPRNPKTGEFIEKTGGHASWLMRLADRTQGPNIGGRPIAAHAAFGPKGTGKVGAGDLKKGDHVKAVGVDSTGRSMTLNGYVLGASPVSMRKRGGSHKTPMIAVSMAETPSGGGANWRGTVYVSPAARVQKTTPKADVARLQGTSGDDKLASIMGRSAAPGLGAMSDAALDKALSDQQARMSGLAVNHPDFVEQSAISKALRAEKARRTGGVAARLSDQIGTQRGEAAPNLNTIMREAGITSRMPDHTGGKAIDRAGAMLRRGDSPADVAEYLRNQADSMREQADELDYDSAGANNFRVAHRILDDTAKAVTKLDTPRAKSDDGGMAPTTAQAAPAGTMKVGNQDLTAEEVIALAKRNPARFLEGYARGKFPGRQTGRKAVIRDRLLNAARNIKEGNWTPERAATDLEGWAKLEVPLNRTAYIVSAKLLRGEAKPKGGTAAPQAPKTHAEKVQDAIAAYHKSFAPVVTPPTVSPKKSTSRITLAEMPRHVRPTFAAARKGDGAEVAGNAAALTRDDFDALPESLRGELVDALNKAATGGDMSALATRDRLTGASAKPLSEISGASVSRDSNAIAGLLGAKPVPAKPSGFERLMGGKWDRSETSSESRVAKATFTPARDADRSPRQQFAASMRQLPGAALNGVAAELESGDISLADAADRIGAFRRSLAGRTMAPNMQTAVGELEQKVRAASRSELGLDKPAPTPAAGAYDSITKRATLLAMLRQRNLKAKRGAPEADLRALLVEDDARKGEGLRILARGGFNEPFISGGDAPASAAPPAPRTTVGDAQTVESLAAMKRPALLAVRRNTPGTRTLRRGATEREIAEEIVRARNAAVSGQPANDLAAAGRAFEGKGSSIDDAARSLAGSRTESTLSVAQADEMIADVLSKLSAPGARATTFQSLAMGHGNNEPVAKRFRAAALKYQNEADARLANDFADRVSARSAPKALPGKKVAAKGVPDGYEIRNTGKTNFKQEPKYEVFGPDGQVIGTLEKVEHKTAIKAKGSRIASGWRTSTGWEFNATGLVGRDGRLEGTTAGRAVAEAVESAGRFAQARQRRADLSAQMAAQAAAPAVPAIRPRDWMMRAQDADPLDSVEGRRNRMREYQGLNRSQFEALPDERKRKILEDLRRIADSGDTQTIASNRTSMGTTIRGATAPHVSQAQATLSNFNRPLPPPVDNSLAGRAARLKSGDVGSFGALDGVALHEFPALAQAAGFSAPGGSWKRPKAVKYLEDQVRMGDRRPKSSSPADMAEAMRGADNRQALAILDYVEAGLGLTKADMKAIAKELGVPLRNGDTRTMTQALAAAAKDAPGKA